MDKLIEFGSKAKRQILTKEEAYLLADLTGAHLSEHGGTGAGVIGALAGKGLRLNGSDGRIRGWLDHEMAGTLQSVISLCTYFCVDPVIDNEGNTLPENTLVKLGEGKIKTILYDHLHVLPVRPSEKPNGTIWQTCSKEQVKVH